jgi:predicted metalloprotease with PDZ domain
VAAHADGTQADVDTLAASIARLVREHMAVFGDLPIFEPGHYTFILDYVPWGEGDAMEHRNSTFISDPGVSLRSAETRRQALDSISHEFFHVWNVERIRPVGLEPFDFTRQNITCCLWLAEGFTQYYGQLLLVRAGLDQRLPINYALAVVNGPGRQVRSAVQMSEYGPFADAGISNDVTDASRTFVSYYTYGAGLALGLDFTLREMSQGRVSLDDFMRRLWERHGVPPDPRPGYVAQPYSLQDLRAVLADVSGDPTFADAFFDRYIEGREAMDYRHLLSLAGYSVNPAAPGRGWVGNILVDEADGGLVVGGSAPSPRLVPFGTPAYDAGLDTGDVIVTLDGQPATMAAWSAVEAKTPGDRVAMTIRRRDGRTEAVIVTLGEDPRLLISPRELDAPLTEAQRRFRSAWLGSRVQ